MAITKFCMSDCSGSIVIALRRNSKCGFRVSSQCYFILFKNKWGLDKSRDFFWGAAYYHTHTHTHTQKKVPHIMPLKAEINKKFFIKIEFLPHTVLLLPPVWISCCRVGKCLLFIARIARKASIKCVEKVRRFYVLQQVLQLGFEGLRINSAFTTSQASVVLMFVKFVTDFLVYCQWCDAYDYFLFPYKLTRVLHSYWTS
jgi:hypothetical protein